MGAVNPHSRKGSPATFVFVGLGNPGVAYEKTRHNAGRRILAAWSAGAGLSSFRANKRLAALRAEERIFGKRVIVALPQTYMNDSGRAVRLLLRFYKLKPDRLVVLHDEIDLPLGAVRLVRNRGSAGHRGVESVIRTLGTKDFFRVRIGIAPRARGAPEQSRTRRVETEKFVLGYWTKTEEARLRDVERHVADCLTLFLRDGAERAMSACNAL